MTNGLLLDDASVAAVPDLGATMHALVRELFPLPRSITGTGLRATVRRLSEIVPLEVTEVPSGTKVFDWTVPDEWSLDEAFIEDGHGRRIVDAKACNLHVVNYSVPVDATMTLQELRPHLHSIPEHPDWIPYRTSYYVPNWGFCLADRMLQSLPEGRYRVVIRSKLAPGSLTLAEYLHRGSTTEEVLVFAHDCHPSLANDNLSGTVVAIHLAAFLRQRSTRYSYRFVFAPATIGSITWLARHPEILPRIRHGLVLSIIGSSGPFHYKKSRRGTADVDRAAWHVLRTEFPGARLLEFSPYGYDERQFCSPGINLAVGRLTRTPNGEFPEYHTSADNPDFLSPDRLGEAWLACARILEALDGDRTCVNLQPRGEPNLGRHGLYRTTGGHRDVPERQQALLWVLNQSDGTASLIDIAERSGLPFRVVAGAAGDLATAGLLGEAQPADAGSRTASTPSTASGPQACRVCGGRMQHTFADLGMIPLCQTYTAPGKLEQSEVFYPLHARVCANCWYVGLPQTVSEEELFTEYAYFSRTSSSWVEYVRTSVADMVQAYALDQRSQVVEMASNDGYLLQFFVERGIPALGVEPAANVAQVARESGVPTLGEFFNLRTATALCARGHQADLLLAYNCLDHVLDVNDVIAGMRVLLKPGGVIHVELPYLRSLIEGNEFDTIYHDRCSYFSFHALQRAFEGNGLRVFDVARIPTHGGSLRVRACHDGNRARPVMPSVAALLADEKSSGMTTPAYYAGFQRRVAETKHELLRVLLELKSAGHSIVGYGVPAKGNVLLNYCGIRGDFLDYLVDRSDYKRGKYAPGTRLPIRDPSEIKATKPAFILILPWNIKDEIVAQLEYVREWGGRFVVAVPRVQVW